MPTERVLPSATFPDGRLLMKRSLYDCMTTARGAYCIIAIEPFAQASPAEAMCLGIAEAMAKSPSEAGANVGERGVRAVGGEEAARSSAKPRCRCRSRCR